MIKVLNVNLLLWNDDAIGSTRFLPFNMWIFSWDLAEIFKTFKVPVIPYDCPRILPFSYRSLKPSLKGFIFRQIYTCLCDNAPDGIRLGVRPYARPDLTAIFVYPHNTLWRTTGEGGLNTCVCVLMIVDRHGYATVCIFLKITENILTGYGWIGIGFLNYRYGSSCYSRIKRVN